MFDSRPKELIFAEELVFIEKVEESLEIIRNYERKHEITPKDQLWVFLSKSLNILKSIFSHHFIHKSQKHLFNWI